MARVTDTPVAPAALAAVTADDLLRRLPDAIDFLQAERRLAAVSPNIIAVIRRMLYPPGLNDAQ